MFAASIIPPDCKLLVAGFNQTEKTALMAKLVSDMFKNGNYSEVVVLCSDYSKEIYETMSVPFDAISFHTDDANFCEILQNIISRQKKRKRPQDKLPAAIRTITVIDNIEDIIKPDLEDVIKSIAFNGRNWRMLFVMSISTWTFRKPYIARNFDGVFFMQENKNTNNIKRLWENCYISNSISLPMFTSMENILQENVALFVNARERKWCVFNINSD